jgi:WD40 repeat protein
MIKSKRKKNHKKTIFFLGVFVAMLSLTVINNLLEEKIQKLKVLDNMGVSFLETIENSLVCVFMDGQTVVWDLDTWKQTGNFQIDSNRAVMLDSQHIAVVTTTGKKRLTVYQFPTGQKQKELVAGRQGQQAWLSISPDKRVVGVIRRNQVNEQGQVLYEISTLDLEDEIFNPIVPLTLGQECEDFVHYAIDNNEVLYAVGHKAQVGSITALNMKTGRKSWENTYDGTKEFCHVAVAPDNTYLYAGNCDGVLYKLDTKTGQILKRIKLLEKGETRPITNDFSVLNLAFSENGEYFVATIHPKAYFLKTDSDEIFYLLYPANRLVSKIAFLPGNNFVATSDIRAGYPIKIWPLPQEK